MAIKIMVRSWRDLAGTPRKRPRHRPDMRRPGPDRIWAGPGSAAGQFIMLANMPGS
jgi:hypothetical protein